VIESFESCGASKALKKKNILKRQSLSACQLGEFWRIQCLFFQKKNSF
jgi:hypothetical protein